MPRQARIDIPGYLYHVMARGIERRRIFIDKRDYEDFLSRLEKALEISKVSPEELVKQVIMGRVRREEIFSRSQVRQVVKARALYCYLAKERGRMNGGQLMRQLRLTSAAISHLVIRGRELYGANKL